MLSSARHLLGVSEAQFRSLKRNRGGLSGEGLSVCGRSSCLIQHVMWSLEGGEGRVINRAMIWTDYLDSEMLDRLEQWQPECEPSDKSCREKGQGSGQGSEVRAGVRREEHRSCKGKRRSRLHPYLSVPGSARIASWSFLTFPSWRDGL